ncbi:MAG: hypothetical protein HYX72_01285 [Acidobacteria bacterium]|nr:hypothetical protein [Acidobacteriota bacterium]
MSGLSFANEIDRKRLVETILEKTKTGKLNWRETAMKDVYIISVGGNTTLKVSLEHQDTGRSYGGAQLAMFRLLDEHGTVLLEISESEETTVRKLLESAKASALNVDDRVQSLMEVLQKL